MFQILKHIQHQSIHISYKINAYYLFTFFKKMYEKKVEPILSVQSIEWTDIYMFQGKQQKWKTYMTYLFPNWNTLYINKQRIWNKIDLFREEYDLDVFTNIQTLHLSLYTPSPITFPKSIKHIYVHQKLWIKRFHFIKEQVGERITFTHTNY
jgi:hypothetical protein